MTEKNTNYWKNALVRYETKDWVNKPTLFAQQVISYFPKSGKLLELGAGQGQDSLCFSQKGFAVTATDFVNTGLQNCEKKAKAQHLSIDFQLADISKPLAFLNETFDVVYSHLGLHYLNREKTQMLFKEIHRILKPDGLFITLLNTIEDPELQSSKFEKIEDYFYREMSFDFYKRYFSIEHVKDFTDGLFEFIILDNRGQTYKDEIKTLIRLVAKKKSL